MKTQVPHTLLGDLPSSDSITSSPILKRYLCKKKNRDLEPFLPESTRVDPLITFPAVDEPDWRLEIDREGLDRRNPALTIKSKKQKEEIYEIKISKLLRTDSPTAHTLEVEPWQTRLTTPLPSIPDFEDMGGRIPRRPFEEPRYSHEKKQSENFYPKIELKSKPCEFLGEPRPTPRDLRDLAELRIWAREQELAREEARTVREGYDSETLMKLARLGTRTTDLLPAYPYPLTDKTSITPTAFQTLGRVRRDALIRVLSTVLDPWRYTSTQDSSVTGIALRIVSDLVFIAHEARAVYKRMHSLDDPAKATRERYEGQVVGDLSRTLSQRASNLGLNHLQSADHYARAVDAVAANVTQINRVNFCPAQIREIISVGRVKEAYVEQVGQRVERLMTAEL
jgi:hypothetical protein